MPLLHLSTSPPAKLSHWGGRVICVQPRHSMIVVSRIALGNLTQVPHAVPSELAWLSWCGYPHPPPPPGGLRSEGRNPPPPPPPWPVRGLYPPRELLGGAAG